MLVTIVMVPNADNTGPDLDRLEKVEDLDLQVAQNMLQYGTARVPSDEELAEYRKTHPDGGEQAEAATEVPAETPPGVFAPKFKVGRSEQAPPTTDVPAE